MADLPKIDTNIHARITRLDAKLDRVLEATEGSQYSPLGSSPPARGTPQHRSFRHDECRFIPARAGNTYRSQGRRNRSAVHPRPRGEHLLCSSN